MIAKIAKSAKILRPNKGRHITHPPPPPQSYQTTSAADFAIAHLDWYLVPYFMNGCLYAMCFVKTGDIKTSMTAHGLYNIFVLLCSFYYY